MRRITPVVAITAVTMVLATMLVAAELFRAELHLAAVGVLLWGFAATVRAWKQQATISILHGVRRLVAQPSGVTAASAPAPSPMTSVEPSMPPPAASTPSTPPPMASTPTPPAASTPAPTTRTPAVSKPPNPAPDAIRKLRQIGVWSPPKTSPSQTHGRIAASVAPDPDAPFRLFAATNGFGASDVSNVTARSVALVGSDALAERLAAHFTVQRMHPRLSRAELEHALPTTLVVEEDALDGGPWTGALDPHGSSLLSELQAAQAWIRRNAGINYVLPATKRTHAAAPTLRAETVVVREPLSSQKLGPATLIDALLRHTPLERHP